MSFKTHYLNEKARDNEIFTLMGKVYNPASAQKLIDENPKAVEMDTVEPDDFSDWFSLITIDKKHSKGVNLKEPGIAILDKRIGGVMLIDGWHRAYKAHTENKKWKVQVISDQKLLKKYKVII